MAQSTHCVPLDGRRGSLSASRTEGFVELISMKDWWWGVRVVLRVLEEVRYV
jgi:hypothetical protein